MPVLLHLSCWQNENALSPIQGVLRNIRVFYETIGFGGAHLQGLNATGTAFGAMAASVEVGLCWQGWGVSPGQCWGAWLYDRGNSEIGERARTFTTSPARAEWRGRPNFPADLAHFHWNFQFKKKKQQQFVCCFWFPFPMVYWNVRSKHWSTTGKFFWVGPFDQWDPWGFRSASTIQTHPGSWNILICTHRHTLSVWKYSFQMEQGDIFPPFPVPQVLHL